jgi:hypothetical protein
MVNDSRCRTDFFFQRVDVSPLQLDVEQPAIEVAVRTDALAERNVEIETETH